MAVTVEELQILLSCDTSQAEKALQNITTSADKVVKKLNGKTSSSGDKKGQMSYYEKLEQQLASLTDQASRAFAQIDTESGKVNFGHIMSEIDKVNKKLKQAGKQGEQAYEKMTGESLTTGERQIQVSTPESNYSPYEPPNSYYDPAEMAKVRQQTMRELADIENGGRNPFEIDTGKLIDGSPIEKLGQQLNIANAKVAELEEKLNRALSGGKGSDKIASIAGQLQSAVAKAEKLEMAFEKMRLPSDSKAAAESTANGIAKVGNEADKASTKVQKYNNAVKGAGNSGSKSGSKLGGAMSKLGASIKRILMYRLIRQAITSIINAMKEGYENAYKFAQGASGDIGGLAAAMDKVNSATLSMKNQLGAAFLSLLASIAPIIQAIIGLITALANALTQLFSVLGGHGTYMKAVDGLDATKEAAGGAGGAVKGLLADFDELTVIGNSGGGGGGGGGLSANNMFKETELDSWAKKLGDFFDKFDLSGRFEKIKDAVDRIINSNTFQTLAGLLAELSFDGLLGLLDTLVNILDYIADITEAFDALFAFLNDPSLENGYTLLTKISDTLDDWVHLLGDLSFDAILLPLAQTIDAIGKLFGQDWGVTDWVLKGKKAFDDWSLSTSILGANFEDFKKRAVLAVTKVVGECVALFMKFRILVTDIQLLGLEILDFITQKVVRPIVTAVATGIDKVSGAFANLWNGLITSNAFKTFINGLIDKINGLIPWINTIGSTFDKNWKEIEKLEPLSDSAFEGMKINGTNCVESVTNAFDEFGNEIDNEIKKVRETKDALEKTAGEYRAKLDISINAQATGLAVGSVVSTAINAFAKNFEIPKMASGGIVYGSTIANVAEYSGARTNPEVIAPLSDLNRIIGNTSNGKANNQQMNEQNSLLRQQNELLAQLLRKEMVIQPSSALGQVVTRSQELYARA